MTPRRRIAAATLGAALLGGTLVASPATAQQREYTNPYATHAVPSDLDVTSLHVDANRSTVTVRLRTQNLGDDFDAEIHLTKQKVLDGGPGVTVRVSVRDGEMTSLEGFSQPDVTQEGNATPVPGGALAFQRTGDVLAATVRTTWVPWGGPVHVGARLDDTTGNIRVAAEALPEFIGPATLFGPVTTAADGTSTALRVSASRQVYDQSTPARLTATVPAAAAGTVTFRDGARVLGVVKQAGGTARLTLPRTLLAGTHTLTATFTPTDRLRHESSTAATWLTVLAQRTTTSLRLSKAKQTFRGKKPARATITVTGRASGTVTVYDGRKRLKTVRLSGGRATYTLPRTLKTGKHSIKAVYRPAVTGTYASSTSRTVRLTVTR